MDAVRDKACDYILEAAFDRLASFFGDFFRGKKHYKTQLSELKVKLQSIEALVDDAEQKQFRDQRVRDWLLKAKDVVFEIEDLSDEIDCEHSKCEEEAESQGPANKVRSFFKSFSVSSFEKEIESRMKQIRDDLDDLASQIDGLGLKKVKNLGVGSGSGSKESQELQSTSSVVESDIYGRDYDKKLIFDWLTSNTDNKLSILSIVGMGGLGKTTLAQLVYNDPRIESKFDIKAWVCVSEEFNVLNLSRAILDTFTKSTENSDLLEIVHSKLKEKLIGKRFLLVLDDVWNEKREEWKAVQTPLNMFGAQGSRILVTTRSKEVAFAMQSKVHSLRELQEDYCWQLFAKHAFQDDDSQPNPVYKEIGMKIVKKCKGLPLALKTMGSLLYNKSSDSEWESVLQSEIWEFSENDRIIPALALSYHHLPPHLKKCFAYCGLFPKDCEFEKGCLIQLWMAENFLDSHQFRKSPEKVGEQYFNHLLSRSFFQQSSEDKEVFVMHDLLNDLAKYVCGDMYFRLGVDQAEITQKTIRHFSVVVINNNKFEGFGTSCDTKRLRTFMPISRSMDYHHWHCNMLIDELLSKFKFLHVLSLARCSDLKEVPDSVGNLNHLRSLDLSHTVIIKLPDSTCSLSNLQILKLNYCFCLEELPLKLHELTSLRRLEIMYTGLRKVPPHLGNLQVLISSFNVGNSSEFTIQQLGELNLHGRLSIGKLQNIENPSHALEVGLKNIAELELRWDRDRNPDDSEKERDENVIEKLQPSEHLKKLAIWRFGGTKFPSWLSSDNTLRNLVSLRLDSCQSCLRLPCLGDLQFLKDLEIIRLDGIVNIDAEFHGSSSSSFTSLEELEFRDMRGWEKWECQDVTGAFPRLQHLSIVKCPKLKGRLPVQLVQLQLKTLFIYHSEHLVDGSLNMQNKRLSISSHIKEAWLLEGIGHIISNTSLQHLRLDSFPNFPMSQSYDFLGSLTIDDGCDSLVTFPLDSFPTLGELDLSRCPNLQRISQEHTNNHLRNLTINECLQLESLPKRMKTLLPSLEELKITDCIKVELFPEGGLPSNLRRLFLYNCSKFIASLEMALGVHLSLETLYIGEMDRKSYPDEDLLSFTPAYLCIRDCPSLQCLPEGLYHLSSLQELVLLNCRELQCLPEKGLPKSITTLNIWDCPLLHQRCQEPDGEDWPKIALIQNLDIR